MANTIHRIAFASDASSVGDRVSYFGAQLVPGSSTATIKAAIEAKVTGLTATVTGSWATHLDIEWAGDYAGSDVPLPSDLPATVGGPAIGLVRDNTLRYYGAVGLGTFNEIQTFDDGDEENIVNEIGSWTFPVAATPEGSVIAVGWGGNDERHFTLRVGDVLGDDDFGSISIVGMDVTSSSGNWTVVLEAETPASPGVDYLSTTKISDTDPGDGVPVNLLVLTILNVTDGQFYVLGPSSHGEVDYNVEPGDLRDQLGGTVNDAASSFPADGFVTLSTSTGRRVYTIALLSTATGQDVFAVLLWTLAGGSPINVTASVTQEGSGEGSGGNPSTAAVKSVGFISALSITETFTTPFIDSSDPSLSFSGLDTRLSLGPYTLIPVTGTSHVALPLVSGAATIDLTALVASGGGTLDATGKKVRIAKFKNPSAHAITVSVGASNGYGLLGSAFRDTLQPGQERTYYLDDAGPTIDSTHRTLDVSGTGSESLNVGIAVG